MFEAMSDELRESAESNEHDELATSEREAIAVIDELFTNNASVYSGESLDSIKDIASNLIQTI